MSEYNYVFIKNNIVVNTVLFDNPSEETLNFFKQSYDLDLIIPENGSNKAIIGSSWDGEDFILPKPFNSWTLDLNKNWTAPEEYPSDGSQYYWDEQNLFWALVPEKPEGLYLWNNVINQWEEPKHLGAE